MGSQPVTVGLPEKAYPGSDGITTSKASAAPPPYAVGSVSGPMTFSCSITDPGHPWVMMIGKALGCFDRTWMKWTSTPSISVTNCGSPLRYASHSRQLYSSVQ